MRPWSLSIYYTLLFSSLLFYNHYEIEDKKKLLLTVVSTLPYLK